MILISRYVDAVSVINGGSTLSASLGTTPAINTVKYEAKTGSSEYIAIGGIELIAHSLFTDATCDYNNDPTITHDANTRMVAGMSVTGTGIPTGATIASVTSTTAFELSASTTGGAVTNGTLTFGVADLSIPAQNVVSYGKKFAISEVAQHYDPFNGFTNSTSLHSAFVDTATSLGLSSAPGSSASWAISGSNNIRPYNGGRVVKWVDASGNIKTSVTMMPPNAQNVTTTASNEITTPSATNTTTTPNMSDDAVDHSLSEVAKIFDAREFGNGAANQGNDTSGTLQDASMLNAEDDIAYVMDDGLTSHSGKGVRRPSYHTMMGNGADDYNIFTFIGTGITNKNMENSPDTRHIAQNLPYGTHILKLNRNGSNATEYTIDGVSVSSTASACGETSEVTFYQPKKPPIPEDCVVLADYMLMADYVKQGDAEDTDISKGVRLVSGSRDHLCNVGGGSFSATTNMYSSWMGPQGLYGFASPSSTHAATASLPFFGSSVNVRVQNSAAGHTIELDGSATTEAALDNGVNDDGDLIALDNADGRPDRLVLGQHTAKTTVLTGAYRFWGTQVISPTHSSSHYQTFETPFLHELVGGDRNMEQTNLVVTPDGKTWDEVTRDVSYLGPILVTANIDQNSTDSDYWWLMDNFRGDWSQHGNVNKGGGLGNKDFAISYDRWICLKNGQYKIETRNYNSSAGKCGRIYVNGSEVSQGVIAGGDHGYYNMLNTRLFRGDYVQVRGEVYSNSNYYNFNFFNITKL